MFRASIGYLQRVPVRKSEYQERYAYENTSPNLSATRIDVLSEVMQTSVAFLGKTLPQRCNCQTVNRRFLGITYLELRHLRPSTSQTFNSLSSLTVTSFRPPSSNAAQEIG